MLVAGSLVPVTLVVPITQSKLLAYHVIADALIFLLIFGLFSAGFSRAMLKIYPLSPGNYRMDNPVFIYWKILTVLHEFGRGALLPFTTVFARPVVASLFGARIGKNTALGGRIADPFMVTVEDGAVLGHNSMLTPHTITSGRLLLHEVKIGRGATIGINVAVMAGAEVGEGSVVTAGSVVPPFTRIPPGELWGGLPARRIKALEDSDYRS